MSIHSLHPEAIPPPDGGCLAWTQVILCHLVMLNTWGLVNSFGTFQSYYATNILTTYNSSSISWIGSIQVFLLYFVGAFTGHFSDLGFFRPLFFTGSLLIVLGLLMASFATSYWLLFITQGICIGLGNGFLFCPSLSILSTYFNKKRGLAMGICAAGSSIGGIIYSALFSTLLPELGFSWTMRIAGLLQFTCLITCSIGIKPRIYPKQKDIFISWKSFIDLSYVFFTLGIFFNLWGLNFVFQYVPLFSTTIIGLSFHDSIDILIILNGVGILGRILPNLLADYYFGSLNSLIFICISNSLLSFCWIAVDNRESLYAWAVFFGTAYAAAQSLYPASLVNLTADLRMVGTRMGIVLTTISFTALTGPPIAGQLIQIKDGRFLYAQIFSGLNLLIGSGFLLISRIAKKKDFSVKI